MGNGQVIMGPRALGPNREGLLLHGDIKAYVRAILLCQQDKSEQCLSRGNLNLSHSQVGLGKVFPWTSLWPCPR